MSKSDRGAAARAAFSKGEADRQADNAAAAREEAEKNRPPVVCLGREGSQYVLYSTAYRRIERLTAEKLNLPQVTYAAEIKKEGNALIVKRMLEDGYMTIKVQTPCLVTCIKELNIPRYLSVGGAFEAYSKPLRVMGYEDLKDHALIDATTIGLKGSPTNIFKSFTPPQKGAGMMLPGAEKADCENLASMLAAKHII